MKEDSGRVAVGETGSRPTGQAPQAGLDATRFDPARVAAVVDELAEYFGPGHSNGVVAILVHPSLPEHFGREEWAEWTFKPAPAAYEWAFDRCLILPSDQPDKWVFTPLGLAVSEHFRAEEANV